MPSRITNKGLELNYQMKKKANISGYNISTYENHTVKQRKNSLNRGGNWTHGYYGWSDWARWPNGDRSGDAIMVVSGGKEEMNVTLKCWVKQHL